MEFTDNELEELLTINEQSRALMKSLTYCEELSEEIFNCMKNKKELKKEFIKKAHNNYLALHLIGLSYIDTELFKKLDNFMDNN